jgi:DNA-binding NtrC family response regulator
MPTVLLVKKQSLLLENFRYELEQSGYTVLAANSGASAIRVSRSHSGAIDVLISDVLMHPVTGFELAAIIKSAHPKVKVILMSSSPTCILPLRVKANDFLDKPLPYGNLLSAISRHCQRYAIGGDGYES